MTLNIRQQILVQAISDARANQQPLTVAGLAPLLPPDFGLIEDDLIELPGFAIEGTMAAAEAIDELGAPLAAGADEVSGGPPDITHLAPAGPPTEAEIERASNAVIAATDALSAARARVVSCQRAQKLAADRLAAAVTQFQTGFDPYDATQLAHDFAKGEAEQRGRVARGEAPPQERPRPANSTIDRQAWHRAPDIESGRYKAWARRPPSVR